ncbi:MAG TPA: hypothetical protein VHU24_10335 [Solirubrobacterales bacterium]|jgi:hypothetical protein|nr:hypothetical protein [Solirubrobacterales bacterium]
MRGQGAEIRQIVSGDPITAEVLRSFISSDDEALVPVGALGSGR